MRQFTRRAVLAGNSAVAASTLSPFLALRTAAGQSPCPTKTIKQFLADAKTQALSPQERADLVDQAIALLNNFYAHLPLKRALYGIDPLERLRLLRQRLTLLGSD